MTWIDKLIEVAQKLGALTPAAIFALIAIAQGYILYKKEQYASDSNEKWRLTREGQIRAEEGQTSALAKGFDVIAMNTTSVNSLSGKVDVLVALIKDRGHV